MRAEKWKAAKSPLYRGSDDGPPGAPTPGAHRSIVRHVLYLEGPGRPTPYLSVTEDLPTAERFGHGSVWETSVTQATGARFRHIPRKELLQLLTGQGKGDAHWPRADEVAQARRYVEEHAEHLLDGDPIPPADAVAASHAAFARRR